MSQVTSEPMNLENKDVNLHDELSHDIKKSKLHPAPEDPDCDSNSKVRKTSKNSQSSNPEQDTISVNREEGEIEGVEASQNGNGNKSRGKSASKAKSASKSRSQSRARSKSKSKSNLKTHSKKIEEVQEDSKEEKAEAETNSENSASYNLRPRKPVDYTVTSPEAKTSGTGADSERMEDKSDVSFKVDEEEKDTDESPQKEEGEISGISGSPLKSHEPQNSENPKEENHEEAQESDSEDEEMEKVSPEELKDELKDLHGKKEFCILINKILQF